MADLDFDMPQNQSSSIKVIGVGGGGSNAVNYMYHKGIKGVDFVVCNTDQQALDDSPVPTKIQLGVSVTEGLGAGAWPLKGRMAAEENLKDVVDVLECNTKMVFINAGMGGGTGTGAAPVIAKAARDLDILTVAIVTIPFVFEGELRMSQAKEGIEELKEHVDSLIVINNNKLREIYGNLGFKSGFAKADEILATASRGIAEVITQKGHLNIDLNDAKTVLSNSGTAIMGSGTASGDGRAIKAVKGAIESPLLDNNHIRGAKKVLLLIVSGAEEVTFEEMGEISDFIQDQVMIEGGAPADIIMGVAEDDELESSVNVTVVATGFHEGKAVNPLTGIPEKVVHDLEEKTRPVKVVEQPISSPVVSEEVIEDLPEETVKHILTIDPEEEFLNDGFVDRASDQEEITLMEDVVLETVDASEPVEPLQQVSMTFEFDMDQQPSDAKTMTREEPKVVFNLIEEIEEERLMSEHKTLETSGQDFEEPLKEVPVSESTEMDLREETISFQIDSDTELQEASIDFSIDSSPDEEPTEEKIIHTLSMDDSDEITEFSTEETSQNIEEPSFLNTEHVGLENERSVSDFSDPSVAVTDLEEPLVNQKDEALEEVAPAIDAPLERASSTHSKAVQEQIERAQKRKERLQKFNYRFRNNGVIDKAENEPAYKRQGIELNQGQHSSDDEMSRLSLNTHEDGEIELSSKNSFLHDNVD
ncbi:MAG: cell division protein FtsZ [Flavobacteriales bacterium]|nr:cell division protein FtsZ [Flavobacteriales bacterium]